METAIKINIEGDVLVIIQQLQQQFITLDNKIDALESNAKSSFKGVGDALRQINVVAVTQSIENFRNTLNSINQPGLKFESQMAELSAITGVVGDDLKLIGDLARKNAKVFGGDASDSVEGFKLLLSQLSPELAKQPEVLAMMGDSASILSKQMGGDVPAAVGVLTTAMNQYGVDLSNPIKAQAELNKMMNAMAQGAADGSSELPQLKEAIQKSGAIAKDSGVSFSSMIGSLQELDKAGFKASEGGTAYNAILREINKGRFMPTEIREGLNKMGVDTDILADRTVSFTDKMRMLEPVMEKDRALFDKLFGTFNAAAASMVRSADAQDEMALAAENSNIAFDQANTIMDTKAEKLSRLNAWFTDVKISIGEMTGNLLPYTEGLFGAAQAISTVVPAINGMTTAYKWLQVAENKEMITKGISAGITGVITAAQWLWNGAMSAGALAMNLLLGPIGIAIGVIALIAAGVVYAYNNFEGFRNVIDSVVDAVKGAVEWLGKFFGIIGEDIDVDANVNVNEKIKTEKEPSPEDYTNALYVDNTKKPEVSNGLPFGTPPPTQPDAKTDAKADSGGATGAGKNITVTIQNLVKDLTVSTSNMKESPAKIRQMIAEALTGAVRDFETTI